MSRQERTGLRDLTYSAWHREWAGLHIGEAAADKLKVIDLDWVEFCGNCWWPLALMELAVDDDQINKTAIVTQRLAGLARLPSAVVFYRKTGPPGGVSRFRVRVMTPAQRPETIMAPHTYARWLWALHSQHLRVCQGNYGTRDQLLASFPPFELAESVSDAA
jgi:hypothetical protein